MKWLLEKDTFAEGYEELIAAIKGQGHQYKIVNYTPMDESEVYDAYGPDDCVLCYGSLNLMRRLRRNSKWINFCNIPHFECRYYYAFLGKYLLNSDYAMMPVQELLRNPDLYYKMFGIDDCIFVRPSSGLKEFTGLVIPREQLSAKKLGFGFYHDDPTLLAVVSSPKVVREEFRFIIADHKVITGSQYQPTQLPSYPQDAFDFAQKVASEEWTPDLMYTIDVARCNDELKLLEINSFSCSGLYKCDKEIIVRVASEMAQRTFNEFYGD